MCGGMCVQKTPRHNKTRQYNIMNEKIIQSILRSYLRYHQRIKDNEMFEGSLEVKLPTICRDGKAEVGRVREEKSRSEKIRDGESQRRQDAGARKGREVAIHCVFPMVCGSGGSKSNLAKAAGAEPAGQVRDEKVRAVVARSTFPSQKGKHTSRSEHFWKLSCRKSASRCGAKHMSKSKCTKNVSFGPLLEVEMSKKCTSLWREAHFQVKSVKNPRSQSVSDQFWKLRCRKSARRCGAKHISKSKVSKHEGFGPLFDVQMLKKCTPLWREAHFQVKSVKN